MSISEDLTRRLPLSRGQHGGRGDHFVQFYDSDEVLVEAVGDFLETSLSAQAAAVVIATQAHLEALERYARARGVDLEARRARGQYVTLDAASTLAQLMVGESPDPARFAEVIEPVIAAASSRHGRVAAFGEMVALLWTTGRHDAAVQLEMLWNELAHRHQFSLFCAYPMRPDDDVPPEWIHRVCDAHTRAIPAESYSGLPDGAPRAAEICALQHKASTADREAAQRRVLEQALAREASQLADFLNGAPIAMHSVGPDGRILWANQAELDFLGYPRHEYVGRPIMDFHADPEVGRGFLRRLLAGESLRGERAEMLSKDGTVREVLVDSNSLWDGEEFVHSRCITRDAAPATDAEQMRARLAAIVESSDDAIVSKSLDGLISSWNTGAVALFGYSADEIIGKSVTTIIPPELQDEEKTILRRLRAGERIEHFETTRLRKDGRRVEVSLTVSPVLDPTGKIIGASKVARDITDRKLSERRLREADQRKDEFLAMLGHELRNPLAPIRNVSEVLRRTAIGNPNQEHACRILDRQVQHMTRLLDDLLDMSRIRQGKIQLQKEVVDVLTVVARAVESSRPLIDARHHELRVALPAESMRVYGDVTRLVQMLGNLLNNAAKYTPEGGQLAVSAQTRDGMVELRIKDTGVGIPPDMLPLVFDLFVQAEQSMDRSQGGLGIGLSLVRTIAELHGGKVDATSAGVGQGSEFVVQLPLLSIAQSQPDSNGSASSDERAAQAAKRVLIVDDNRDASESLAVLLRMGQHQVLTVETGHAALESVRTLKPDLVLLDIGLPDLDGYEVARRLRKAGYDATLAALTGYGQPGDRARAREAGFDHHFVKPVDPRALDRLLA